MIWQSFRSTVSSMAMSYTLRVSGTALLCYGVAYFTGEKLNPIFEVFNVLRGDIGTLKSVPSADLGTVFVSYSNMFDSGWSWTNVGRFFLSFAGFAFLAVVVVEFLNFLHYGLPVATRRGWLAWISRRKRATPVRHDGFGDADFENKEHARRRLGTD